METLQRDVVRQHRSQSLTRTVQARSTVTRPATPLAGLQRLQRTAGNVATTRLLRSPQIQAKLTVGPADDMYEREADAVAGQVMRMPEPMDTAQRAPLSIQRLCPGCEEEQEQVQRACAACEQELHRQPMMEDEKKSEEMEGVAQAKREPGGPPPVSDEVESYLSSNRGAGQPLPGSARSFFEPRFGRDFGAVRVHADSRAGGAAQSIQARAFTVGSDIVFGANQYNPGTQAGQTLLAHELTHVVQQGSAEPAVQPSRVPTST